MEDNKLDIVINAIKKQYGSITCLPFNELEKSICGVLDACGIMYRMFSRVKMENSIITKMKSKLIDKYIPQNRKMQDLFGIRIVLYFEDDVANCISILNKIFQTKGCEHDHPDVETFKPIRINYVFELPHEIINSRDIQRLSECYLDSTFEVQIRTIFSEGWHEIEHDIKYKYKDDWKDSIEEQRELNGTLAALEVCDNYIRSICEKIAHRKYKAGEWEAMIRTGFRLRFSDMPLNDRLIELLNEESLVAKEVYRYDRKRIIELFQATKLPVTYDNVVYIINEDQIHEKKIALITPQIIMERMKKVK